MTKPFIKWVGGKSNLVPELESRLPTTYTRYVELFLGGGALFFHLKPQNAVLQDYNKRLINTYLALRDTPFEVIKSLSIHSSNHSKEYYYTIRQQFNSPDSKSVSERAADFIYLNKTCFNGLYRENRSGGFNVPVGSYSNPTILDTQTLLDASECLQTATLMKASFEEFTPQAGDFIYMDPPYYDTFTTYNSSGFGEDMQRSLHELCVRCDEVGARFMQSNSNTEFITNLYSDFNIELVSAARAVSCKSNGRGRVYECLIRNFGS